MYIGSWKIDDLVTFTCNTHTAATGAATDADGAPAYRVYEDETTTPILTGTMALLDGGNTAGFYSEQITLSAANGFEKGKSYNIYISAAVATVTGTMHHTLQLEAEVDANRINWANVDNPTTALNLSGTNIDPDQVVASVSGAVGSVTGAVGSVTGAVGSVTGNVGGNVAGSVGSLTTNNDKTGYALSAPGIQEIWDALTSALTTVGSVGKLLVDNLNATVSSRSSHAAADIWSVATRLLTAGTNIVLAKGTGVTGLNDLDAGGVRTAVGLASANLDTQLGDLPTAAETTDAVWDELLSGHVISGSTGAGLSAAGSAGDPWSTALPGAYGAGTAGAIVGTNLDATVGTRATQASVNTIDDFLDTEVAATLAAVDTEVAAIKIQTDLIPASPAAVGSAMTLTSGERDSIGTAILKLSWVGITGEARYSLLNMGRKLLNKWSIVGAIWSIFKEDGTTVAYTETLTTDAAAEPVTGSTP